MKKPTPLFSHAFQKALQRKQERLWLNVPDSYASFSSTKIAYLEKTVLYKDINNQKKKKNQKKGSQKYKNALQVTFMGKPKAA